MGKETNRRWAKNCSMVRRYVHSVTIIGEEKNMQERIEKIIKDWLTDKFGNENAIPKLMLSGIAEEIYNHRWEIHTMVQEEYDMEDIEDVASANAYELTKEEKERILHRYKKLEDGNLDLLYDIVDEVYNERGEN